VILYLASDLVWATKIKSMGEDVGVPCRPVRNLDMLTARLADTPDIKGLILDLESPDTALALLTFVRDPANAEKCRNIRVIAFAPHVKRDIMQAAVDAGAHQVLPRGAFDHDLADILIRLEGTTRIPRP
jgi:CheY-like chemotaxis protein